MKCPSCGHALELTSSLEVLSDARAIKTSTSNEAQERVILEELRKGPRTTDQLRAAGAFQSSARIFGLRRRGFDISTTLYDGIGADNRYHCRMALYTLKSEPLPLDAKTGALDTCPTEPKGCNPITPEAIPSAQMEIESAGSRSPATAPHSGQELPAPEATA